MPREHSEGTNSTVAGQIVILSIVLAFALSGQSAHGQYVYSVAPGVSSVRLTPGSGEVQSAIIAPGKNAQCPAGRLFFSMDADWPPQTGSIVGADLNNPANQIQATFETEPDSAHDAFLTNDNDLLSLPNGDLLFVWGFRTSAPLNPKPGWFDVTFYLDPNNNPVSPAGVRRGEIVYRSQDCGQSFQFMSKIDPARVGDGSCADPQPHGTYTPPPFLNGGTDGQLTKVLGGNVYMTTDCVGFLPDMSSSSFALSSTPVNRTYVLQSTDEGASWNTLGYITGLGWRTDIELLANGDLAFAFGTNGVLGFGHSQPGGTYAFSTAALQTNVPFGWAKSNNFPTGMFANRYASALLTRGFSANVVTLAYPAAMTDSQNTIVDGYELYFYNENSYQLSEDAPIFPAVHSSGNYTLYVTAVDPGQGPILLYWMDVNANENRATMMGRLLLADGTYSNDFPIAETIEGFPSEQAHGGIVTRAYSFSIPPASPGSAVFYGDYHTAGAYSVSSVGSKTTTATHHYYPIWIESDNRVHYSHVEVTFTIHHLKRMPKSEKMLSVRHLHWHQAPRSVELRRVSADRDRAIVEEK